MDRSQQYVLQLKYYNRSRATSPVTELNCWAQ